MKVGERLTARGSASGVRRAGPAGEGPTSTRQALTRFAVASLVVAVAVGVAGAVVSRRAAQTAATDDARTVTEVLAHSVIIPNLTDGLVDGDPAAIARMDQAVVGKVTAGSLVRVKLWTPEGKIVYSDEHRLIGASYPWPWTSSRSCATTASRPSSATCRPQRIASSATRAACSRSTWPSRRRAGTRCCSRPTPGTAR